MEIDLEQKILEAITDGKKLDIDALAIKYQTTPKDISDLESRYHSLAAVRETMPKELMVTAVSDDDEIMAVMHKDYPIYGVQFHPESVLTPDGSAMIRNFLRRSL